jgi:hypothetical protein
MRFFLSFKLSRPSLHPFIKLLIQWVPAVKRLGHNVGQSPSFYVEVKKEWSYTSTPLYGFMAWTGPTLPLLFHTSFQFFRFKTKIFTFSHRGIDAVL